RDPLPHPDCQESGNTGRPYRAVRRDVRAARNAPSTTSAGIPCTSGAGAKETTDDQRLTTNDQRLVLACMTHEHCQHGGCASSIHCRQGTSSPPLGLLHWAFDR